MKKYPINGVITSDKPKVEKPISGGYWQNVFVIDLKMGLPTCSWVRLPDGRWLWPQKYPTKEIAETNKDDAINGCACYFVSEFIYKDHQFIWDDCIHTKGDA